MQEIFVVLGLTSFVDAIFEKLFVWDWLYEKASRIKNTFIFKLLTCKFCMMFHLSWMTTIIVGIFGTFSWHLVMVPFISMGLYNLIQKR